MSVNFKFLYKKNFVRKKNKFEISDLENPRKIKNFIFFHFKVLIFLFRENLFIYR